MSSEPGRAACQVMRRVSSFIHPIYLSIPRSLPKSSVLWVLYLKFDGIPPYFLNRLDVLMNPCDIWRQKSDFFLRQRTSCMFVAICNKGFLKVNCGSRSRLALFSGKALMSEEIRASKGTCLQHCWEREREKNDGAQWEQTKHELNQCAEPESASAAAVRFTFMGFRSAEVLSWPPALILIRFQSLQTPCIWSLFHKTRLKHCWTTKVPRLMCTVKNKSSAFTLMWLSLGGNISWLTLCEEGHCCTVTLAKHPIKSRDNSKKSGIKRD